MITEQVTLSRCSDPFSSRADVDIFNWCYVFEDNSRLMGQAHSRLDADSNTSPALVPISAQYLDADGKTVLVSWQAEDFFAFEIRDRGENTLIVASNDNCLGNSFCLVSGNTRTRSQVTEDGLQVVGESFRSSAWSFTPEKSPIAKPAISWNWSVSPFFPFVSLGVNLQSPNSKKVYRWTVSPYLPFCPCLEVTESVKQYSIA